MNYYSEWEPYAAQWIRNLIDAGLIPPGHVDTRSITDVQPSDLAGYRQCHFFAGIAGWSLAARLAGWPDNRELWTGSAPCQPFSVAGKGKAQDDDRHLWPHFLRLIRARRPAVVMGEQVAAAVGKNWLDGVSADLEAEDYACRAVVVPACAVDAPHRRDRLWFVAHSERARGGCEVERGEVGRQEALRSAGGAGGPGSGIVADADRLARRQGRAIDGGCDQGSSAEPRAGSRCGGGGSDVADRNRDGREPRGSSTASARRWSSAQPGGGAGAWDNAEWIKGHDGKARRVPQSGIRLLAHGVLGRMAIVRPGFEGRTEDPEAIHWYSRAGALKAFGNAIVPEVAAEVIGAYMDCYPEIV